MEFEITVKGCRRLATRERVIETLSDLPSEPQTPYMVDIEGVAYPVKQAFCETFGVGRHDVGTRDAQRALERLGFKVTKEPVAKRKRAPREKPRPKAPRTAFRHDGQDWLPPEALEIPDIWLQWSYYERWEDIAGTGEHSADIDLPPGEPGVYEVGCKGQAERLAIGKASDLRRRVRDGLVKGTMLHSAGQKIRENENPADLRVRWAVTDRPAAAEEELHRRHIALFGRLPKYTSHT